MTSNRYPLGPDRALVVSQVDGLVVLGVRGRGDVPISGPLAIRETNVGAFLAAVTRATGAELAGDMERAREVLRTTPGIAGFKRLRAELAGMSMERRRAAVRALQAAGELVDRGDGGRPRLYIAPKPGYSHRNPPQSTGVGNREAESTAPSQSEASS